MKKNTKFIAIAAAAIALFFTTHVNAQETNTPPKFGIGLNVGIPTNTGYSFAIGGDLRYQFDIDKQLSVPITAGFTSLQLKDSYDGGSFDVIPVKAGLKVFFSNTGAGAYGLGEVGAAFSTNEGGGTSFAFSPAVGYAWSNGLDLAAKYEGYSKSGTIGYAGIRLAYGFKL